MPDDQPMNGLRQLLQARDRPQPPGGLVGLLKMRLLDARDGEASFAAEPDQSHVNPGGIVHGGYLTALLDTAMGAAAMTQFMAGQSAVTIELKVSFLLAARAGGGTLRAHGRVIRLGRRVAFTEATLTGPDGRVMATASSTLLIGHG